MDHWYWSSHFFTQPIKILIIYASIYRFWAIWYMIQYHACCRTSFFGRVNKALEIFHYPTREYPTTRLLSSLPYPTLPETEKSLPVRAWSQVSKIALNFPNTLFFLKIWKMSTNLMIFWKSDNFTQIKVVTYSLTASLKFRYKWWLIFSKYFLSKLYHSQCYILKCIWLTHFRQEDKIWIRIMFLYPLCQILWWCD